METKHNDLCGRIEKEEGKNPEEKKRKFRLFKDTLESVKKVSRILAIAVGTTVFATACMNSVGRYAPDISTDSQEEVVDAEDATDAPDVPDVEPDEIDAPDVIEEDVVEDEVEDVDAEEDGPEPTCFDVPVPLDPTVDPLLNSSNSQDTAFGGPGTNAIDTDVVTNVSMTGYPDVLLGVCPEDSDRVAFVASPGTSLTFESDISAEAGTITWSATVPDLPGIECSPLSDDSQTLISKNDSHQAVPKNADMEGRATHAGFDLTSVSSTLVAYEKDGVMEDNGLMTITGSNFVPVHTAKAALQDGDWNVDVEVHAGESSADHVYTTTLTGDSSKEARIYPSDDNQMYSVTWDESRQYWCSRCTEHRDFELVIPGDLICKVVDECGCVGDGLNISIVSVALDKTGVPPHLVGLHEESSPAVRTGTGVSALSDPATDHPEISISFSRGSVSFDGGEVVNFWVTVVADITSEHMNPSGGYDTTRVTMRVPVTDPWAWGTLEPTYTTYCLPCTVSY
jgi:hypothetical protein